MNTEKLQAVIDELREVRGLIRDDLEDPGVSDADEKLIALIRTLRELRDLSVNGGGR